MSPQAKRKNLFYVSDLANNVVYVYTYPQGKLQGTLTGFNAPGGECVDKSGDVFITNGRGDSVDEYAHGAKMPKASLAAPGQTWSCSVDPTTGNLAVLFLSPSQGEGVAIYPHGQGSPTFFYASPNAALAYCGFDNSGNLFLDGGTDYERVSFWEIPKGKNKLQRSFYRRRVLQCRPGPMGRQVSSDRRSRLRHDFARAVLRLERLRRGGHHAR